ncbi:MAG TPA: phosphatidate cytidylyltransferase [Fimbriimonadaceae bacterium]|nr:phosphatidate cytidylyltransferase [Fimbriimonadaceae bacterium]
MKQRIATAAVLIPLALLIVGSTSPIPISIAAMALAAIGVYELAQMFGQSRVLPVLTLASLALPFYSVFLARSRQLPDFLLISALLFLLGTLVIGLCARNKKVTSSVVDVGGLWVSMPLLAIVVLHELHTTYIPLRLVPALRFDTPALIALVPVWAGDTAAIFVGKLLGKHQLSKLSPGKTVEGGIGNLAAAILAAWGIGVWLKLPLAISLPCGVAAGVLGQAGDLFQSYLKRRAGVKDSGRLLPGHGGLLDRIDSVLFAAMPIALIVYFGPSLLHQFHAGGSNPSTAEGLRFDQENARIVGGR